MMRYKTWQNLCVHNINVSPTGGWMKMLSWDSKLGQPVHDLWKSGYGQQPVRQFLRIVDG